MATYHLRVKDDTKSSGKRVSAKRHADYILREEGNAHADYINREGAQSNRDDCVYKGSRLPKWAKGSAQKFFGAATRYEDKGNVRYREIELSLPNELTLEQNREIVDTFLKRHLSNNYYAYAIHEKAGELSGERHPHVHIMFSERLIDDVEKVNERPAYKYFRRAAKPLKGERVASFERRREHGAPKDKKWHDKKYLFALREDFARIQNDVLKKHGFSIRVDHRTLKAQQESAEKNGDDFLAKLYKRVPESYIGIIQTHTDDSLCADVKRYRQNMREKQHSLFLTDFNRKAMEEAETLLLVQQAESAGSALIDSTAFKSTNLHDESLRALNQKILAGLMKIYDLRLRLVGYERAREQAQKEYLSVEDHRFILVYKDTLTLRDNLERLLKDLIPPSKEHLENLQAFQFIERGIKKRISYLRNILTKQNPQFWTIQEKMQNPQLRKNIELVIHGLLQNDIDTLSELKKTSIAVLHNVKALREKLEVRETPKIPQMTFNISEVRDNLREQYYSLKRQYETAEDTRNHLMFKRISPSTALCRAKNIFVHGNFDKLHFQQENYEKALAEFKRDQEEHQKQEQFLKGQKWTNNGEKLRVQYYLTKEKFHLEETARKLEETKIQLDRESKRLETLCQTGVAQGKIALIAADILHDNLKIVREYENAQKTMRDLYEKIQLAKKRFNVLDENYSSLKKNYVYRVIQSESDSLKNNTANENALTAIIADALLGEPYAVQLVARSDENSLEMEKDWELMSELDKDEFIRKKIIRQL